MAKTGNSKYYPQNTTVHIAAIKDRAEIFWQTVNANHLLENYTDKVSQFGKDHDLKFNDFKSLLSGNTVMKKQKEDTYIAVAYDANKKNHYFVKFALSSRFKHTFIIIITAYATKDSHHIQTYKEYQREIGQKFSS